jgi:hypothetical protein
MNRINQKVEVTANILIIVVAVLLIGVLSHRYFFKPTTIVDPNSRLRPTVGKKIKLADVNFADNRHTVILALQKTCRFCNESIPFYKRLLAETKDKNIRIIAIFPSPVEESTKYLAEHGIHGFEVKQAPISVLDASGTPTLVITNDKGEITNFWIGKLPAEEEVQVIEQVIS